MTWQKVVLHFETEEGEQVTVKAEFEKCRSVFGHREWDRSLNSILVNGEELPPSNSKYDEQAYDVLDRYLDTKWD